MDYDHMLNGCGSRQHHQDMIKQAQRNKLTKEANSMTHNNIRYRVSAQLQLHSSI